MPCAGTVFGVLLAGGQSRRMGGGDKSLLLLNDETILSSVISRTRPQVAELALNANGDPERFRAFGLPVLPDGIPGFAGPLAGILAGLDWAAAHGATHVASFATDAPFLPADLVARLAAAAERGGAEIACAASLGRLHPVFALWPVGLRGDLGRALAEEGLRKVRSWTDRHSVAVAEFVEEGGIDPFLNVNTPDDLALARHSYAGRSLC